MKISRSSGLLLHITSLPGKYGVGTLGKEAYDFIDLLKQGSQKYWQILPINPVSPVLGFCPYSSISSFAGNPILISLETLQQKDWIHDDILSSLHVEFHNDFVDFDRVFLKKMKLLFISFENFKQYSDEKLKKSFNGFCEANKYWLDDYAIFSTISSYNNSNNWLAWDKEIRFRNPEAIKKWGEKLKIEIEFQKFLQFVFFYQWKELKKYANKNGVKIIGDLPIYVSFDSADTWSNPNIFQLDKKRYKSIAVSGVPPDYFSKTGQMWGNPLYDWFENNGLKNETIMWWQKRFKHIFGMVDIVRIDHFRGFESYWSIPSKEKTAVNGKWMKGPGVEFFKRLEDKLGDLPLIAEDLGNITCEVEQLRDDLNLPGMKILQFAFDFNKKNPYLPHNFKTKNCIVYTGTHDNNTTNGWFYGSEIDENTREYIIKYLGAENRDEFHWKLIRIALSSVADLTIFPVQDILGYGEKFRMNNPASSANNWRWKLTPGKLNKYVIKKLKDMCELYNRA